MFVRFASGGRICWLVSASEYTHLGVLGLDLAALSPDEAALAVREWHAWESPSALDVRLPEVLRALGDGTARVYAQPRLILVGGDVPATDLRDLAEPEEPEVQSHWVEVRLLDEAGDPRAGEPYRVILGDDTELEGQLDAHGVARVPDVPDGPCRWYFPSLHAEEWGRA